MRLQSMSLKLILRMKAIALQIKSFQMEASFALQIFI